MASKGSKLFEGFTQSQLEVLRDGLSEVLIREVRNTDISLPELVKNEEKGGTARCADRLWNEAIGELLKRAGW